ncbi:MAG: hypothetical protein ABGX05_04925, partial [Pirellulaceae bacterium]
MIMAASAGQDGGLSNSFQWDPQEGPRIRTSHRCIQTPLPAPDTINELRQAASLFPAVSCYQPP